MFRALHWLEVRQMTAQTIAPGQPTIGDSPPRLVLYQHRVAAHEDLPATIGRAFGELYEHIGDAHVKPAGEPFVVYLESSQPGVRWEVDICAPVSARIPESADFGFMEMQPGRMVSLLHVGPYEGLAEAYATIERFIQQQGLTVAGPPREIYLSEPDVPPAEIRTLVEQPVA
jgi:effector-binding domain-containing protein